MRELAAILLILIALAGWWLSRPAAPPRPVPSALSPLPAPPAEAVEPLTRPVPADPAHVTLTFRADNASAKVITEVERATRPRECSVASAARGEAHLTCLLIDADVFVYQLDADLSPDAFPCLKQFDFKEADGPWARTISTYRSLAKTALNFRAAAGDRLLILLCPKADWTKIDLNCLHFVPKISATDSTAPRF